jgi:DNA modification methylase
MNDVPRNRLLTGDVLDHLARVPDGSVDMVLTSPPYFRLRDYQVSGQLGLEATVQQWAANQRRVAAEVARVLVPTGTYWLNLGDSYSTHPVQGAARKSLLLAPERLALVLLRDGWTLRNKIVWHKPNAMPSSVRDRLNTTWEIVYVFTRGQRYFFDLDAIRQPHRSQAALRQAQPVRARRREVWRGPNGDDASGLAYLHARGLGGHVLGKNPGDVWPLASSNYRGGHHATFPLRLAERIIRAGCPEARCIRCRKPWLRPLVRTLGQVAVRGALQASCDCAAGSEPGLVLDPFIGSGTTAVAAERLGRDWLGIELNPAFAELARQRIAGARGERARAP